MKTYNSQLPQLQSQKRFLMDGGLETTLIFQEGIDLPEFAAFPLLETKKGRGILKMYYTHYIDLAIQSKSGFILESPTWRASSNWGKKLGYSKEDLRNINHEAIQLLGELKERFSSPDTPMVISGCLGPQGDGYHIDHKVSISEARQYHSEQIHQLKAAGADLVSAYTINLTEEATGIALAAKDTGIPSVISFTVETDGRLPSGQPLGDAITTVDQKTGASPVYYMINCAHPSHFKHLLHHDRGWLQRIKGVRANASKLSHQELDEAEELDRGNIQEFGQEHFELSKLLPNLSIFGGCCGTDHHHIAAICDAQ